MKVLTFSTACAVIALTSVASAQDGTFNATFGAGVFDLPSTTTGVFNDAGTVSTGGSAIDTFGLGLNFGVDATIPLAPVGDMWEGGVRLSAFGMVGISSGSTTNTYSGTGTVTVPGYTLPAGDTIVLVAPPGNAASSTVTSTNPQGDVVNTATVIAGAGTVNAYGFAIAPGGNSFSYSGASLDGASTNATAWGAIGATDGGLFQITGTLDGLTIETSVENTVFYGGTDIAFALDGNHGDWSVQGYAGPSYRFLSQQMQTDVVVNVAAVQPAAPADFTNPTFTMSRAEDLMSHYLGGVAGGSMSTAVGDNGAVLTFGAEGGIYYTIDSLSGTESYTLSGGSPDPTGSTTVVNSTVATGSANGIAWAGSAYTSIMMPVSSNQQVSLGVQADYLSRVATVTRPDATGGANLPTLSFGDMWAFTGTISFTGQF